MPGEDADAPLVRDQVGHAVAQVLGEAAVRHVPHLHRAVLGRGRDQVVVVGAPGQVEHGRLVADDEGRVPVHAARPLHGQHQEGAAARRLRDYRHELTIEN